MLLHGADHIRQGTGSLTHEVFWGGAALAVVGFSTVPLAVRRHPRAPLYCAAVGLWTVLAVSASHLAPHWSAFSNPYPDLSVDALSWAAMLTEVVAGGVLAAIGIRQLRGNAPPNPAQA
jgi:hypothetical protein